MSANAMFKKYCIDFVSKYHYVQVHTYYAWENYIEIE